MDKNIVIYAKTYRVLDDILHIDSKRKDLGVLGRNEKGRAIKGRGIYRDVRT